jgi:hypothetical protein
MQVQGTHWAILKVLLWVSFISLCWDVCLCVEIVSSYLCGPFSKAWLVTYGIQWNVYQINTWRSPIQNFVTGITERVTDVTVTTLAMGFVSKDLDLCCILNNKACCLKVQLCLRVPVFLYLCTSRFETFGSGIHFLFVHLMTLEFVQTAHFMYWHLSADRTCRCLWFWKKV